jgi:hypothetical protein
MKTQILEGVPYRVSDNILYIYGTNVSIGTVNKTELTKVILDENWQTNQSIVKVLEEYRNTLHIKTQDALKKAQELQKL